MNFLPIFLAATLAALPPQQPYSGPGLPPSPITGPQAKQQQQQTQQPPKRKGPSAEQLLRQKIENIKQPQLYPQTIDTYTLPGVVVLKEEGWVGSDNIYNISKNISVMVEIEGAESANFPGSVENIKRRVEDALEAAGIKTQALYEENKPPLPMLSIVIIVQPINKGFAYLCAGYLLEDVDVKRVRMTEGVMQAITWERQHLVVSSTEETPVHLGKCVDDIANAFVKVFKYYQTVGK